MKPKRTLFVTFLIFVAFSCNKDLIESPDGKLLSYSSCKNDKNLFANNNETCVEYSYNFENSKLNLTHINTSFNCCPEKLYSNINIKNNTIIIVEFEKSQVVMSESFVIKAGECHIVKVSGVDSVNL